MKAKKGNWFTLKLLLFINAVLITVFVLAHSGVKTAEKKETPCCSSAKKINAEIINAITVKLM